ncbi:filament-like plant protein 7 isoform X2 [Mercurialis annua]|uniref:filament-like plant protein 7 isoform X2 n=1 Tax=Mercurialis annua TaxID=3986 RepID=UPI0021600FC1|nr:filament-like plant protein 7 isoform X2 [Mercurialis annua]
MDKKSWPWRKKSAEKTIIATNKFDISPKGIDEQIPKPPVADEVRPVGPVRNLSEIIASVLLDSHAKDALVLKQENLAQEEKAGQEKAEVQVVFLKKELDEAIKQSVAANEKITDSDAALKHCMQQLSSLREEQERKTLDAAMKASSESEKERKHFEEKFREMSRRLADLAIENTNMSKALVLKEKSFEELRKRSSQTAAEFNGLMTRLESTEKENTFLKYEFHMLEKELEVRNEELEYTRRSAEASHRQQLESIRKITKLEAECQRLRIQMRKKLLGPFASAKMKNEVEMLGRKPNPIRDLVLRETHSEKSPEIPVRNINFLVEQLRGTEEENRVLKDILTKKNAELRASRIMYSNTASRLSQVKCTSPLSNELHRSPVFDTGSDDGVSSSGSWANALITELEHFRDAKLKSSPDCKSIEVSDISLMNDFVEMEKLAILSSEAPYGDRNHLLSADRQLIPVVQRNAGCIEKMDNSFDWLQEVLSAIFKQQRISKRSLIELLDDIKIALGYMSHPPVESDDQNVCNLQEENKRLKDEQTSVEAMLQTTTNTVETLTKKLQESEERIKSLNLELETIKASKGTFEDQIENQKLINEDLDTQLAVSKAKLNEVLQRFSSLEVELEDKYNCCEELEATCLELQFQLESVAMKDSLNYSINDDTRHQDDLEITAASLKLAECQETILNLGKQLKALATPREAALFDKVFNTSNSTATATFNKHLNRRFSLRDQMQAEDTAKGIIVKSPTKDSRNLSNNVTASGTPNTLICAPEAKPDPKHKHNNTSVGSLAIIVPVKKQGGASFLRRLLMRTKKRNSKKSRFNP